MPRNPSYAGIESGPEYYRRRAAQMSSLAERAPNETIAAHYYELAEAWTQMARQFETGDRWRRNPQRGLF